MRRLPGKPRVNAGHLALGVALATVALASPFADASPAKSAIVLEAHVGQRSPEVAAAIAPVLDELEHHGFAVNPDAIRRLLRGRAPRSGRLDEGTTVADIKRLIAAGRSALDKGLLEKSETTLRLAADLIQRNPALLVLDTNNDTVTYEALVSLAMILAKRGKTDESNAVMMDLLRVSSMPIPEGKFGPKAQDLHAQAEKQVQTAGRGSLTISVSDKRAMIFVDYTYRGLGRIALGDQLPGSHHVLVQIPGTAGLQYTRDVQPGSGSTLNVNWPIESLLHLDGAWAGLLYPSEAERTRQASIASELSRSFDGDDMIILGVYNLDGTKYLGGIQYPASGEPPVGAFAPLDGGELLLRALGRYLYDGTAAAGLRLLRRPATGETATAVPADSKAGRSTWLPVAVGATGALVVLGGAVEYLRHPYDSRNQPADGTDGRNSWVGVMVSGSVALGGGVYLWSRDSLSASRTASAALGMGVAALGSGLQLYLVNQQPSSDEPRYIRQTRTLGLVVGGAGIAATGIGIWLLEHEGNRGASSDTVANRSSAPATAWAPFVSVGSSGTLVGCTGRF